MIILERIKNNSGNQYAQMSYEPIKNYLHMKWIGRSSEDDVKRASLKMLEWQQREGKIKKCNFHVHDTKELEGAWVGLVDWINNEMFTKAFESGLKFNVSILSPDLFSKLSSLELYKKGNNRVPTVLFETISDAEKWIKNKNLEF